MLVAGLEQPQDQSMLFFCIVVPYVTFSPPERPFPLVNSLSRRVALGTRMIMPQPLLTLNPNPNPKETELRKADRTVALNR